MSQGGQLSGTSLAIKKRLSTWHLSGLISPTDSLPRDGTLAPFRFRLADFHLGMRFRRCVDHLLNHRVATTRSLLLAVLIRLIFW